MKAGFECGVTAGFLGSARMLANASHCAALIGAAGALLAQSLVARLVFVASLLCWPAACYFGLRCAIDAALFRDLPLEQEGGGQALDAVLRAQGFLKAPVNRTLPDRTLADRCRGALALWRRMVAVVVLQMATALAGIAIQALAK